jgi:predicted MFS family arabinose efflux permease
MAIQLPSGLRKYFLQQKALLYGNYRLFLVGQGLSQLGTWIQRAAMLWLTYKLTNSKLLVGLVGFCEQIPIFAIAPFAGVFADKWNKHKALIIIDILALLQAFVLGVLTFIGMVHIVHIVILSLFLGVVSAFEVPIRQSFVVEMVNLDKAALPNAIALNSATFNLSRLIGPSISGILIIIGETWCFMLNAVSYAIVVASLLLMRNLPKSEIVRETGHVVEKLKEGIVYVRRRKVMTNLLLLLAIVSFSNASILTLAPIFAKNILGGDSRTFGYLLSGTGIGAILGAVFLTKRKKTSLLRRIVSFTGILLGSSIIFFSLSRWLVISILFLAFAGLAQMMHTACTNTLLQSYVDDDKRGRVMSFYTVCLQGVRPFGSLASGAIAEWTNAPIAMAAMGAMCVIATLIFRDPPSRKVNEITR